mgnify:CR=1 FL=1
MDKDIYESLNFSVISVLMKTGNPLADSLCFIIFTFSLAEIRLCRTDVRRRNGYSTILRIFIYSQIGDSEKVQGGKVFFTVKTDKSIFGIAFSCGRRGTAIAVDEE